MISLLERAGERMLGLVVPSINANAAICYGIPINQCAWICCNTTCTVEKRCCMHDICRCSRCQHA